MCVCVYMFTSLSVYITTSPATRLVSMLPVYQGLRDRFMPTRPTTQLDVVCTYKLSVCRCSLSRGGVENKNEKKTLEPFPNCLNYHSIFCGWSTTVQSYLIMCLSYVLSCIVLSIIVVQSCLVSYSVNSIKSFEALGYCHC